MDPSALVKLLQALSQGGQGGQLPPEIMALLQQQQQQQQAPGPLAFGQSVSSQGSQGG